MAFVSKNKLIGVLPSVIELSICFFVLSEPAHAQEMTIEETIESRKSGLHDIGGASKGIRDELKKSNPNQFLVRQYASQIRDLAKSFAYWFPPGSGPEAGVKTLAKPAIWQQPAEFGRRRDDLIRESERFFAVANEGNGDAVRNQFRALGQTCSSCHDNFKQKEQ